MTAINPDKFFISWLSIDRLCHAEKGRTVDETVAARIADSINSIGFIHPLRVRRVTDRHYQGMPSDEMYEVVAGQHRLRAARKLQLETVPCIVVSADDLLAAIATIDENLCRNELSLAERAEQTNERKVLYLALHPETAEHVAGAHASNATQGYTAATVATASFAAATADATGQSARTVRRDAERGAKITSDAFRLLRKSDALSNNGGFLNKLKEVVPENQLATVRRALAADELRKKTAKAERQAQRLRSEDANGAAAAALHMLSDEALSRFRQAVADGATLKGIVTALDKAEGGD